MFRHVLRNATRTLPLIFTLNASEAILTLAGLGFLGFGIEPTAGRRVGLRPEQVARRRHRAASGGPRCYPGLAIVLAVLGITLVGESLNDLADPRLRGRRRAAQRPARRPRRRWSRRQPVVAGPGEVRARSGESSTSTASRSAVSTVVDIQDLDVTFATDAGDVHAVDDVTLTSRRGEVLAIVGESGSGKTVTAQDDPRAAARDGDDARRGACSSKAAAERDVARSTQQRPARGARHATSRWSSRSRRPR